MQPEDSDLELNLVEQKAPSQLRQTTDFGSAHPATLRHAGFDPIYSI